MAKLASVLLAIFLALPAQGGRTKVSNFEVKGATRNYCADFQYTRRYAPCEAFSGDTDWAKKVCNRPGLSKGDFAKALRKEKCISCSVAQLEEVCERLEEVCTAEQLGALEDPLCRWSVFAISEHGEQIEAHDIAQNLGKNDIRCTVNGLSKFCEKHTWKACDTLDAPSKDLMCQALTDAKNGDDAARSAGGQFGVSCSAAKVRAACGKETCASLDEDEWKAICEAKNTHGATALETAEAAQEHEGLTCSEEEIKAKCPSPCHVDPKVENTFCSLFTFGFTPDGGEFSGDLDRAARKSGVDCSVDQLRMVCKEKESQLRSCDLNEEEKGRACGLLKEKGSVVKVTGIVGAELGAVCSKSEIRKFCGSDSCTSFDDEEWEEMCERAADREYGATDFVNFMEKEEGISCTAETVEEKCPNSCVIGEERGELNKGLCQAILFGYTSKGKVDYTVGKILRKNGVPSECTAFHAQQKCSEIEWAKCEGKTMDEAEEGLQAKFCAEFHSQSQHSTEELINVICGRFGMACSADDLVKICPEEAE